MDADTLVASVRAGWLTLCFMMLLSRVVFQIAGADWMRGFLDGWQAGPVKRVWGAVSLAFAAVVAVFAPSRLAELKTFEVVMLVALVLLLVADGLVNVLPAGFRTFKDSVQEAWIRRRRPAAGDDSSLFGVGNAILAAAAGGAAAAVILYKPIAAGTVVLAAVLAALLTAVLLRAATR